jgi:hypothetical protein
MKNAFLALLITALVGFWGCLVPQAALASVLPTVNSYYVELHFGRTADFKDVKSVMAHTGVLVETPSFLNRPPYWADVKDIPLRITADSFVGRASLHAEGFTGSISAKLTPVVQYFISFTDGSSSISEVFPLPVNNILFVYYPNNFADTAKSLIADNNIPTESRIVLGAFDHSDWTRIQQLEKETDLLSFFP